LKRKRCTDSRRLSVAQQKTRQRERLRPGKWKKSEGEQRHHPAQEQEAEAEGHEAAEHLLQPPQRESTLELAGRLEEASVAAAQQVVELAAASDGAYEEEAEV
jgi:hypothetical protein